MGKLIEGEDYYIDRGRMVLTESYLLKRGKCCHRSCRHCPYEKRRKRKIQKIDGSNGRTDEIQGDVS